mgnify:CR=1 FL=1
MELLFLSIFFVGGAMLIMAVGVIFRYPCLRGSCGGSDLIGPEGESLKCAACPRRSTSQ